MAVINMVIEAHAYCCRPDGHVQTQTYTCARPFSLTINDGRHMCRSLIFAAAEMKERRALEDSAGTALQ